MRQSSGTESPPLPPVPPANRDDHAAASAAALVVRNSPERGSSLRIGYSRDCYRILEAATMLTSVQSKLSGYYKKGGQDSFVYTLPFGARVVVASDKASVTIFNRLPDADEDTVTEPFPIPDSLWEKCLYKPDGKKMCGAVLRCVMESFNVYVTTIFGKWCWKKMEQMIYDFVSSMKEDYVDPDKKEYCWCMNLFNAN
jgi:hypothetical protein